MLASGPHSVYHHRSVPSFSPGAETPAASDFRLERAAMSDLPAPAATSSTDFVPPHPGSQQMPRWDGGELPEPPVFKLRNWTALIGPSMVMAAAAIGGGEWLTGPLVTAKYGGALLWL